MADLELFGKLTLRIPNVFMNSFYYYCNLDFLDVPLLRRAFILWRDLDEHHRQKFHGDKIEPLLHMTGGLMIGSESSEVVRGTIASVQYHSLPHEILTATEINERFPCFNVADGEIGVLESEAG